MHARGRRRRPRSKEVVTRRQRRKLKLYVSLCRAQRAECVIGHWPPHIRCRARSSQAGQRPRARGARYQTRPTTYDRSRCSSCGVDDPSHVSQRHSRGTTCPESTARKDVPRSLPMPSDLFLYQPTLPMCSGPYEQIRTRAPRSPLPFTAVSCVSARLSAVRAP